MASFVTLCCAVPQGVVVAIIQTSRTRFMMSARNAYAFIGSLQVMATFDHHGLPTIRHEWWPMDNVLYSSTSYPLWVSHRIQLL